MVNSKLLSSGEAEAESRHCSLHVIPSSFSTSLSLIPKKYVGKKKTHAQPLKQLSR